MKVKVTNVFRKFLQEQISGYNFRLIELDVENYRMIIDYDLYSWEDFNAAKRTMKAIKVIYPADCYAMPRYLSTRELNEIFSRSDRTAAGFIEAIKQEIEI